MAVLAGAAPWPVAAGPAQAAAGVGIDRHLTCAGYGARAEERICSGSVPSFDGSPMDVDLTLPMTPGRHHPLIVLLHGFGNNKHEWESVTAAGDGGDKYHWNSYWFAEHGFYVLTYTARGFQDHGRGAASYEPNTPGATGGSESLPNGTIHLKSREFELHDTQWLAALTAASHPDLDRSAVAVSGGSYGGGESWLQATEADWTFPHGVDPRLPVLHLQVAVPKYPWTDLGYSLAPNGHGGGPGGGDIYQSATGRPDSPIGAGHPFGVVKAAYTGGFYAEGSAYGAFEAGGDTTPSQEATQDGPVSVAAWFNRAVTVGDPYDVAGAEDPVISQARRGLTVFRSSYYQTARWRREAAHREVAVFSISGWTDNLFPPIESFRQFIYLKRLDPLWPVQVAVADVGHPLAQNPPYQWRHLNREAWRFLRSQIGGSHRARTTVESLVTRCDGGTRLDAVTAPTPRGLARGTLTVAFATGGSLDSRASATDPDGPNTDAVTTSQSGGSSCRQSSSDATIPLVRYSGLGAPLAGRVQFVGLGHVLVPYTMAGTTATLEARLWDVARDGTATLVTRGVYRIDHPAYDPLSGTAELPFFGNQWVFPAGDRIRLDLTLADSPTFLASRAGAAVKFAPPTLVLPTVEEGSISLTGG